MPDPLHALTLKVVAYADAADAIQSVRRVVFQVEQQVDPALDFDGLDETSWHVLVEAGNQPIGTARIRALSDRLSKIERVAVLAAYRGQGIGKAIMAAAIEFLEQTDVPEAKINAQLHARVFYEKLGFEQRGEVFDEAGIAHIEMRKPLKRSLP